MLFFKCKKPRKKAPKLVRIIKNLFGVGVGWDDFLAKLAFLKQNKNSPDLSPILKGVNIFGTPIASDYKGALHARTTVERLCTLVWAHFK